MRKFAISGAIAGAATPYILMYLVMPVLNFLGGIIPSFSLKLANPTVAINVRESLTGIQAGLAGWVMDMFRITVPESLITTTLITALGGALLFIAGGYLADMFGQLTGSKVRKTAVVIFSGSIVAGLILGIFGLPTELNISVVNMVLAMLVNAAILSWVFGLIDDKAQIGMVPF